MPFDPVALGGRPGATLEEDVPQLLRQIDDLPGAEKAAQPLFQRFRWGLAKDGDVVYPAELETEDRECGLGCLVQSFLDSKVGAAC